MTHQPPVGARRLLLLLVLLAAPAAISAIHCYKSEVGTTPHVRDCGPQAKGCRIIVNPYKVQNNSAVGTCEFGPREIGSFSFDCAIDCLPKGQKIWNEVDCCTTDKCNDGSAIHQDKVSLCYVSKGDASGSDNIVDCKEPKRCAVSGKTGDTECVEESKCKDKDWWCCNRDHCNKASWGVYKPMKPANLEESTDANNVEASLALSIISLVLVRAATA